MDDTQPIFVMAQVVPQGPDPDWVEKSGPAGSWYESSIENYSARVERCQPNQQNVFRNRAWSVFYQSDVKGVSGLVAGGFCHTTRAALNMAMTVMQARL